jgi:TRAP-type mannitol/chloroaromatic compound transport system permease small subunit
MQSTRSQDETGAPQRGVLGVVRAVVSGIRMVSIACATVAAVVMAILILVQVLDVIFRNATGASFVRGVTEYISIGMVLVVFLSIAYAEQVGAHVRTPILTSRLPRRVAVVLRGVALAITAVVVWSLAYVTLGRAIESFQDGEVFSGIARVTAWPARFAVPLGAFLLGVELLVRAVGLDGDEREDDSLPIEGSVL